MFVREEREKERGNAVKNCLKADFGFKWKVKRDRETERERYNERYIERERGENLDRVCERERERERERGISGSNLFKVKSYLQY